MIGSVMKIARKCQDKKEPFLVVMIEIVTRSLNLCRLLNEALTPVIRQSKLKRSLFNYVLASTSTFVKIFFKISRSK